MQTPLFSQRKSRELGLGFRRRRVSVLRVQEAPHRLLEAMASGQHEEAARRWHRLRLVWVQSEWEVYLKIEK